MFLGVKIQGETGFEVKTFGLKVFSKVISPADSADAADIYVEIFEKIICGICRISGR